MITLPPDDVKYVTEYIGNHILTSESNMSCLVIHDFHLPAGYNHEKVDLLLRLSPGYPDVPPDMWWFDPPIKRADGQVIPATEVIEQYLGHGWQRWSRHLSAGQWRSGIDGIESFLALLRKELERAVRGTMQ